MNFDQADRLNEAIRAIGIRHRALAIAALAPLGIHPGHKLLLRELETAGPCTQAQLAAASGYRASVHHFERTPARDRGVGGPSALSHRRASHNRRAHQGGTGTPTEAEGGVAPGRRADRRRPRFHPTGSTNPRPHRPGFGPHRYRRPGHEHPALRHAIYQSP